MNILKENILKELMQEQGIKQQELADEMKVSRATISSWSTGRTTPKPHQMQFLEELLGVTKEQIFFEAFSHKM